MPPYSSGKARNAVSPASDDDLLAAMYVRMWSLASGRRLRSDVRPDQLTEEELIAFWADDLSPAYGRHSLSGVRGVARAA